MSQRRVSALILLWYSKRVGLRKKQSLREPLHEVVDLEEQKVRVGHFGTADVFGVTEVVDHGSDAL